MLYQGHRLEGNRGWSFVSPDCSDSAECHSLLLSLGALSLFVISFSFSLSGSPLTL